MAKKAKKTKTKVKKEKNLKKKEILTMEDLLALEEAGKLGLKRGEEVKGKITAIKNPMVYASANMILIYCLKSSLPTNVLFLLALIFVLPGCLRAILRH